MNQYIPITARGDVQLWRQGSGPAPGWLMPWMIGRVEANGTFLIETPLGQQRVHRGYVVVEQAGDVSIGAQKGPPIGVQKGPLCRAVARL